jgi:hypothetical protein
MARLAPGPGLLSSFSTRCINGCQAFSVLLQGDPGEQKM